MLIRQGGLDQGDIDRDHLAVKQTGDFREEDGGIVRQSFIDRVTGVVTDKEGVMAEIGLKALLGIRSDAQSPNVNDLGIEEGLGIRFDVLDKSADEILRFGAGGSDKDTVAAMDMAEDFVLGDELFRILLFDFIQGKQRFRHSYPTFNILRNSFYNKADKM
jgi:hypothetical protein